MIKVIWRIFYKCSLDPIKSQRKNEGIEGDKKRKRMSGKRGKERRGYDIKKRKG